MITLNTLTMKYLVYSILFIFIFTSCFAQKTPGYFSIRGGAAFLDENPKGIAHLSFGISPNRTIGIGVGVGFVHIENVYLPLTVDVSYFGKPGRISPIITGSAGYGLYDYKGPHYTAKGGFTGSLNAGIAIPAKRANKFFLSGGYSIYSYSVGKVFQTPGYNFKPKNDEKVFTATLGVKI
jgi:hypothetical protein